eukprot:TRINITY_DN22873_c0_g1_i1.p1 TRINITY_DN22873_c0_g1~~TRINITY_DN22873_c0_g1_i1.p1  ORF type:complete len:366 (+),score=45.70 TRINITY_DN22873_c0_g1_i1:48-1100(+)
MATAVPTAMVDDSSLALSRARQTVLVLGGFGYVAQFVIEALLGRADAGGDDAPFRVHATHRPGRETKGFPHAVTLHSLDFGDADAIAALLEAVAPNIVVNCAAMAGLGVCEKDPTAAFVANCPRHLVDVLAAQSALEPRLLIHFSTDIVFNGDPANLFDEDAALTPINVYGQSKAEFDEYLVGRAQPTCVVLRSSNILGPVHPYVATGKKFLQWLDDRLQAHETTSLFEDEYRNYVWIDDLVAVVMKLIDDFPSKPPPYRLFHCGGPDTLNRVDVARALAEAKRYSPTYSTKENGTDVEKNRVLPIKRSEVDLGYPAPLCLRFVSSRIEALLGRPLRSVQDCIVANVSRI